jgi:hypothetical protein
MTSKMNPQVFTDQIIQSYFIENDAPLSLELESNL